jgi:hypothetical protein
MGGLLIPNRVRYSKKGFCTAKTRRAQSHYPSRSSRLCGAFSGIVVRGVLLVNTCVFDEISLLFAQLTPPFLPEAATNRVRPLWTFQGNGIYFGIV